jgi:hypothetical protein
MVTDINGIPSALIERVRTITGARRPCTAPTPSAA